jgi:hypothetical protein
VVTRRCSPPQAGRGFGVPSSSNGEGEQDEGGTGTGTAGTEGGGDVQSITVGLYTVQV